MTNICPECHNKGKAIDTATVKALLATSLRQIRATPYRFCSTATCDIVYFNEDGEQYFRKADIRERVYQKEMDADDVLICYCFYHTPAEIRADLAQYGQARAIENINAGIREGQCACDWRNPQGDCCLGNVRLLVKQLTAKPTTLADTSD